MLQKTDSINFGKPGPVHPVINDAPAADLVEPKDRLSNWMDARYGKQALRKP